MSSAAEQGKQTSLAHLGAFAAMLAGGHLPRLSSLRIEHGEWTPGAIPHSVFLHLSTFHSVTYLTLYDITLPSITVLLRLVCALDGLKWLYISHLRFLDRQPPPANRRWAPPPALKNLRHECLDEVHTIGLTADLETSSGHALVQFLLKAAKCLNVKQLLHHAGQALHQLALTWLSSPLGGDQHGVQPLDGMHLCC
ncbi:hypothetical protein WOLCODRAFT_26500 [Wolfiporia cocos MD-104 SS10]|uniref:F-box domain-containing protein n=1 Tax=Wolfiporia cocos (strain MD-104) TaxID=742152 RepID=A0A2H3JPM0_WOLCO|nr:hypothetical protein WOLCODRAFT_26500 [Wolfiporia cocos MD-104 SS10]